MCGTARRTKAVEGIRKPITFAYVGKRWVHQLAEYYRELRISYSTKNYRTGIELEDPEALDRRYPYYDLDAR
ncbi:hypothetical protein SAMN05216188_1299 [Lentzea xinjiangensis]|uniref:Uncharacterized protein n=1 Tax=Lentzea xinjiangensis TaxID=402600 RepID=A0A1H9VXY4_9PSEU|nr:hypothetical protein SAMN05216188_1299 [Lentzea xinjiangensis]